jgi:hypothetical protein
MRYFYTNIFGDTYIPYLKSLLVSVERLYKDEVKTVVVYDNISELEILLIKKNYPSVSFISDELILLDSNSIHHLIANKSKGWANFITSLNDEDKVIFLDVDTNLLKSDIWNVFDDYKFDLSLTIYNSGYSLNTGVIFLNVNKNSKILFQKWSEQVFDIFKSNTDDQIRLINKNFGAVDQFVFYKLAELRQDRLIGDLYSVKVDDENIVQIKLLDGNIFNLINSNNYNYNTKVIHFKSGWRSILNKTSFFNINRKFSTSVVQYGIWYDNYLDSIRKEKSIINIEFLLSNNIYENLNHKIFRYDLTHLFTIINLCVDRPILIEICFDIKKYYFYEILLWYFDFVISFVHKRSFLIKSTVTNDIKHSEYIILPFIQKPRKNFIFYFFYVVIYSTAFAKAFITKFLYLQKSTILRIYFFLRNDK